MPRNSPPNGPARLPLSGGANLHRVFPITPTTAERRMVGAPKDYPTGPRYVTPLSPEEIVRVVHNREELYAVLADRLNGPPRRLIMRHPLHVRIFRWLAAETVGIARWELSAMLLAAGVIGFALGVAL